MERFMMGRYGMDQLSRFLGFVTIVLLIVSIFTVRFFYLVALVVLVIDYYRVFSRNISKRSAENEKFLEITAKMRHKFSLFRLHARQSKTYHFYRCPQCRQKVRVPKGKGRICITCPKCRNEFVKKS
jgi:hypothetical protein